MGMPEDDRESEGAREFTLRLRTKISSLVDDHFSAIIDDIRNELDAAIGKFQQWPTDIIHAAAVVAEEAGELAKATLQCVYEPHKSDIHDVRAEALQAAAMFIRFIASIDSGQYRYVASPQHVQ